MTELRKDYVELHASSAFSFLEGGSLPEALVQRAAELGLPAVALLDRNGLYGAPRFHLLAKENRIKAHIGAEILWHQETLHQGEPPRLALLCASETGYQNLCQMVTRFKMREPAKGEGAARLSDLQEFAGGLVCMTGGTEGVLAAALARGGEREGRIEVEKLTRIFGANNVYVELQRHGQREEEQRNQAALAIAESLHLPVLATNGVRYATQPEREILDLFTCIRNGRSLDNAGQLLAMNSQRHLRSAARMGALFCDLPEAIANTSLLSSRLTFALDNLGYAFPAYQVPENHTMDSYLRERVTEGVARRYGTTRNRKHMQRAKAQVEHELALITRLGFEGYFLIVWDIVRYCNEHDILVQGRGSAANSAVCYALGITAIDPIGMDLLFERFLSESRKEWPDIDLDLPSGEKREQAIQHVYRRYGELGAAMTANVITYRGKSAAREVGKALGFNEETLGRLSSMVGQWEWRGATDNMMNNFQHAGLDLEHPRIQKYLELCLRVQDLPRHLGQHSGGMVVCQGMLNRVVPIERASMQNRAVVQWDKEDCAEMGMVKVDLLGLGMMAVLKDCLDLVPTHYGEPVDLAQLPENDEEVYATLRRSDTVGMFQVESRAQMASLPRNGPRKFYDIVVQVAIIRPGPIVGKMMHPYMRRRQNKEEVTYPHPLLEEVLERTLGVPLFQEQLLRIAMIMADFTGSEAEELRKAVGMRRSMARMKELEVKLRAGMDRKGISVEVQDGIVQSISSFALYGFPESHAASFALLAYASAYFKVKYLAAFTCAMLNNQPMGFYSAAVLVKDAQRHGLRIKAVDVQQSAVPCTLEHESDGKLSLRLGLRYAKGLNLRAAEALVEARLRGPFRSTDDLALRVPELGRRDLAQLARIGALNRLGGITHRRDALWQIEQVSRPAGPLLRSAEVALEEEISPLRRMRDEERLIADYAGTGLTTGPHPMSYPRAGLRRQGVSSAQELQRMHDGCLVIAAGCVIARQRPGTAKGFIFLSMEDETGISNIIIKPQLYETHKAIVTRSRFLRVEGKLQNQDGVVHVMALHVEPLSMAAMATSSHDFH